MKKSLINKPMLAVALLLSSASPLLHAASPEDAVEFRQGVFRAMGWNFGPMGAMIQGRKPFDAEAFAQGAERVAVLANMVAEGFIEGTGRSDGMDTRLKEEYWYQQANFDKLMQRMVANADTLAQAVASGKDREELRPVLAQLAGSCKNCHEEYRGRD
ncbi:c-type cytochrome [Marinobacterium lutimaris]|uniref:Cytochrome c556 n=1 Tax=Marinobacterium lutimaris TaxID=568106 RepID=A0A1H6DBC8_9GAMM|nr:cytochrome c [Marinobacterium lutimaris]SEG82133.1 Cytochrome c556 [Marinobacterium lutimaris]